LCGFAPPHFFAPVKMLRIFLYRAQKKRQLKPKRYAKYRQKISKNIGRKDLTKDE